MNPMMCTMQPLMEACHAFVRDHAKMAPTLKVDSLDVDELAPGLYKVAAVVTNHGQLPSCVSAKGATLPRFHEVTAQLCGAEIVAGDAGCAALGHLAADGGSAAVEWVVRSSAAGELGELRVSGGAGADINMPIAA